MSNSIEVVKFGTELIKNGNGIDQAGIDGYALGLSTRLEESGLVVVTSGAVAAGRHIAIEDGLDIERVSEQTLSGMGQAAVFSAWINGFRKSGFSAASESITHEQLDEGEAPKNLTAFVRNNAEVGVVTVLNEADAVSIKELMQLKTGGDNDGLAAHIGWMLEAVSLTLFTKKGGIFDDDRKLIERITEHNDKEVFEMLIRRKEMKPIDPSKESRGGIIPKYGAAWTFASKTGNPALISAVSLEMTGANCTRIDLPKQD